MIQPLVSATTRAAIDKLGDTYNPASGAVPAASGGAPSADPAGETGQASFAQILADAAGGTVGKLENAEALSMRKMSGEDVPIRDVVNAVMDAEQSLSTAIAIRDKIVQAYLEISRMQI